MIGGLVCLDMQGGHAMNFDKVTEYLESLPDRYETRCADVKVMQDHRTIYRHMFGTSDYADSIPVNEDNLYDVYSASKVLTAVAVMQLVERGVISLEDEVSKYLPEYGKVRVLEDFDLTDFVSGYQFLKGWPHEPEYKTKPVRTPIRVWNLLSMTAGLSYEIHNPFVAALLKRNPHAGTREIVEQFAKVPLLYQPGTRYAYSLGHDVAAALVEVVSGMSFSEYMKKNIFDPVGAEDMFYHAVFPERTVCLYSGRNPETGELVPQKFNIARINYCYESGGGGLLCSVDSYIKVLDALACGGESAHGERILQPETIALMSRNRLNEQQLADFHIGGKKEYGYGLGVRTLMDAGRSKSPIGEFGWDGAAGAYALVDPVNRLSLFYVQAAPESGTAFSEIHPTLRDLVYEAIS